MVRQKVNSEIALRPALFNFNIFITLITYKCINTDITSITMQNYPIITSIMYVQTNY